MTNPLESSKNNASVLSHLLSSLLHSRWERKAVTAVRWSLSLPSVRTLEAFPWNISGLGFFPMSVVIPVQIIIHSSMQHLSVGQVWCALSSRGSDTIDSLASFHSLVLENQVMLQISVKDTYLGAWLVHAEQEHKKPTLESRPYFNDLRFIQVTSTLI